MPADRPYPAGVGQVVQLFSNPRAGSHSARRLRALIRAFEELGAQVLPCASSGVVTIDPRATHVCVAAGDGTVRHVAAAVLRHGRALPLAVYPAGTINLLAMEAGYPRDPRRFARTMLRAAAQRRHYPVAVGEGYFFACAGVGPDSRAVDRVSPGLKRAVGRLAYVAAAARMLWDWPRSRIVLDHAGGRMECEALYVAKGRYYAGRWSFAREARLHDPVLHVVALRTARRRDYARFLVALAGHRDVASLPFVEVFTCTALRIECAEPLPLQADGDTIATLPATLTLCDEPLLFCGPGA